MNRQVTQPLTGSFWLGVFDTSVLTSDVTAVLKRGEPSSILAGMQYGTLRGFIPRYVWAEVPRVLADRKREGGGFELAEAERLWWREYVPLQHVVSVYGLPMTPAADKLAQEDLSDVGILQLAGLLSPVVFFASDPDLIRHGAAVRDWGAVRAVLGRVGQAELGIRTSTAMTVATGRALAGAARRPRQPRSRRRPGRRDGPVRLPGSGTGRGFGPLAHLREGNLNTGQPVTELAQELAEWAAGIAEKAAECDAQRKRLKALDQ
jgi:hypothetical protein